MVSLALYQPDQAGNVGTLLRMGACLNMPVHIIHPCGFSFCEKAFRRSAMDYSDSAVIVEHDDYQNFIDNNPQSRIILLTTKASSSYIDFEFQTHDILLLGQESAGVPEYVHNHASARIKIPMAKEMRSMNIAIAGAFIMGEALRQTQGFAKL
ncbi:MAG: tRNA (cytidine/uridine-2'-O-)-methyltransferase [Alphaproteobacteria bacterium]|jgi:tRNA (cytidine/uridine-2'-O-)-methyltransferase